MGSMRSFVPWSLVVVVALSGSPRQALAGDNVVVVHFEGQAPIAEVTGAANVVVPACRGVEWQRFDAELARFVPVPGPGCGPMVPAIPVPAAGLKVPADVRLREGDNVRAVALIGVGCRLDQPLQLAKCARLEAVESAPVVVPPAAPKPG